MARRRTTTVNTGTSGTRGTSRATGTRNPTLLAALALVVCAAGAAGWGGWQRYEASHDDAASFAQARDDALAAGEQAVQNMRHPGPQGAGAGARQLGAVHHRRPASPTHRRAGRFRPADRRGEDGEHGEGPLRRGDRTGRTGGPGRVMVALRVTVTAPKGEPAVKESRLLGTLTRTSGGGSSARWARRPSVPRAADLRAAPRPPRTSRRGPTHVDDPSPRQPPPPAGHDSFAYAGSRDGTGVRTARGRPRT